MMETRPIGGLRMFGIIGTIEASAVIHGGGLPRGMIADDAGVAREAEPVVFDNPESTPEFEVIGYATDRSEAVEVAHSFADSCGLVFVAIGGPEPKRSLVSASQR